MPKIFVKIKVCGCIVEAICCEIKSTDKGKMYVMDTHNHFTICDTCNQDEENGNDTLYDMWKSDNITDDYEYAGWKEKSLQIKKNKVKITINSK
jgi:hypothetical protein